MSFSYPLWLFSWWHFQKSARHLLLTSVASHHVHPLYSRGIYGLMQLHTNHHKLGLHLIGDNCWETLLAHFNWVSRSQMVILYCEASFDWYYSNLNSCILLLHVWCTHSQGNLICQGIRWSCCVLAYSTCFFVLLLWTVLLPANKTVMPPSPSHIYVKQFYNFLGD